MPIAVLVTDDQHDEPLDGARWQALAGTVLAELFPGREVELSLSFVDAARIAALNEEFLGHEGATDVLSFPIEEDPLALGTTDAPPLLLGDVVICPAVAASNAPEHAGSFEGEIALLLVHGILHLVGLDHEADDEAEAMERREQELLSHYFREAAPS